MRKWLTFRELGKKDKYRLRLIFRPDIARGMGVILDVSHAELKRSSKEAVPSCSGNEIGTTCRKMRRNLLKGREVFIKSGVCVCGV